MQSRIINDQPGWELYRSLLAVVRTGSLSAAARSLGLTQPTVGRHVDALEKRLGTGLFLRSQSGLQATDAALDLVPHAEAMEKAAEALVRTASGRAEDEHGSVRVTASELIGVEVVTPLLASFRARHPRIAIELMLSSRTEDLLRGEADIAVRLFRPTQAALVARHVGSFHFGLYAHRDYVASRGAPRARSELARHSLVGFDSEALIRRSDREGITLAREMLSFRCDSYVGQYAAIKSGFGVGTCMSALARRDGLVPILEGTLDARAEIWLVMHEDLRTSRRVRLLYDHLAKSLAKLGERETQRPKSESARPTRPQPRAKKRRP